MYFLFLSALIMSLKLCCTYDKKPESWLDKINFDNVNVNKYLYDLFFLFYNVEYVRVQTLNYKIGKLDHNYNLEIFVDWALL